MTEPGLLIVGASARAAAFSALRANFRPWCVDLFADADLYEVCSVTCLPRRRYPQGLAALLRQAPQAPWMYTGALENQPEVVRKLAKLRTLWGNGPDTLRRVRDPWGVEVVLREAGLACPRTWDQSHPPPRDRRWILKPLASAAGRGIAVWEGDLSAAPPAGCYLQEFVDGIPCSGVYVGHPGGAVLLGVTRQLIGEPWVFASGYQYCGSIGPLELSESTQTIFANLGEVLGERLGLRGLFGVDCLLRDGVPFPVEINPRYTASVEVLEIALGIQAVALHCLAFVPDAAMQASEPAPTTMPVVGKAILFARSRLTVPDVGPWSDAFGQPCTEFRAFADVPHAGQTIEPGEPVLTVFARAASEAECGEALRAAAQDLDRFLLGR